MLHDRACSDRTSVTRAAGPATWAGVKGYLGACTDAAVAPVIEKYTGVLAAAMSS